MQWVKLESLAPYLWATASFFGRNWGNIASVLGAVATVYFSLRASSAAIRADEAAQKTREQIKSFDLLSELNRIDSRISELLVRIETEDWSLVADRAIEARQSVAAVIAASENKISKQTIEKLTAAVTQFRSIAQSADRARKPKKSGPDTTRLRRIAADQQEAVRNAVVEVKIKIGV